MLTNKNTLFVVINSKNNENQFQNENGERDLALLEPKDYKAIEKIAAKVDSNELVIQFLSIKELNIETYEQLIKTAAMFDRQYNKLDKYLNNYFLDLPSSIKILSTMETIKKQNSLLTKKIQSFQLQDKDLFLQIATNYQQKLA